MLSENAIYTKHLNLCLLSLSKHIQWPDVKGGGSGGGGAWGKSKRHFNVMGGDSLA